MAVTIVKADGTREPFKPEKLKTSLKKAGATNEEVSAVLERVEKDLHDGITTKQIYEDAFEYLRTETTPAAARYSLRRALFGLGPTGFPFEDFLARIFQEEGYTVKTGVHIKGKCVKHELDLAAYTDDHAFVAEAKFHARPDIKSDLQVAMYSHARQLDLAQQKICTEDHCGISDFMIITNTKFTSMARKYAACVGLELLSWNYPEGNNLHDRVTATNLYPVTVLQSLSRAQTQKLIEHNTIICSDIDKKPHLLRPLHLSEKKIEAVRSEIRQLCQSN